MKRFKIYVSYECEDGIDYERFDEEYVGETHTQEQVEQLIANFERAVDGGSTFIATVTMGNSQFYYRTRVGELTAMGNSEDEAIDLILKQVHKLHVDHVWDCFEDDTSYERIKDEWTHDINVFELNVGEVVDEYHDELTGRRETGE